MATWSPARPERGGRCKYTLRQREYLRAKFKDLLDRRGVVRLFNAETGIAAVRWDDVPGELDWICVTLLVREDHEGEDPFHERCVVVDTPRVLTWEEYAS